MPIATDALLGLCAKHVVLGQRGKIFFYIVSEHFVSIETHFFKKNFVNFALHAKRNGSKG